MNNPFPPRPARGFRVPDGQVRGLAALRQQIAGASDRLAELSAGSHPEEFRLLAEELRTAYETAHRLAGGPARTGCDRHPHGAVDPEAPEGWGACLICNARRRVGMIQARNLTGERLTGATSGLNRSQRNVERALAPSEHGAPQWRERPQPELDSPILRARRERQDPTHAAALAKARAERAARKDAEPPPQTP